MGYRNWSNDDLINAVKTSTTKSDVIRKLGLKATCSGNFQTLDKYIKELSLDTSHFKSNVLKSWPKERSLKEILVENSTYTSTKNLKTKLLKFSLLDYKCYSCGINEWIGKKLNLQLDHINGNRIDNRIENLRLLCPNCHSLTPTFCRGFKRTGKKCVDCNVKVSRKSNRCAKCDGINRRRKNEKINWPPTNELLKLVEKYNYSEVGRKLGVSDNAIRKRLRNENCAIKNKTN